MGQRRRDPGHDLDHDELVAALEAAAERESELRGMLDLAADSIMRFDSDLRYDYVNDRTVAVSGIPRERWIGRDQRELGYPEEEVLLREERLHHVFATGETVVHEDEFTSSRGRSWYETQLFPLHGADGKVTHVVVIARNITARKRAEAALVRAAERDPLTGLANRLALVAELDRAIAADTAHGEQVTAVLLVDLDHFKHVNDSLGHSVGDELLRRAAERLLDCVRAGDLVSRHGGDEFVVVMRGLDDPAEAVHVAMRIVQAFREPLVSGDTELSTTASVGISLTAATRPGVDATDLLREADTAMYVAKDAGRDGVSVFDEQLRARVDERLRIENELRGALRRGELAVWYQPEVDLDTGRIAAVEALLRWQHPSGEVYPAARFVDVAAETGLIVELGTWVLDQVCAQAAAWNETGIRVRVNLAPRQLDDPELLDRLDRALARSGVDGSRLCVEITETALLHDTTTVAANLAGITARGLAVALDDFGTGFASLTYLRRYHIDVIKVDRSFVAGVADDERQRQLTSAIVALAHQLDMTVVAEGVERAEQAEALRRLGCKSAQGFLFSPAVPAPHVDRMLVEGDAGRRYAPDT